jgi:hypothetical protein
MKNRLQCTVLVSDEYPQVIALAQDGYPAQRGGYPNYSSYLFRLVTSVEKFKMGLSFVSINTNQY